MKSPFNPTSLLKGRLSPAKTGVKGTWGNHQDAIECARLGLAQGIGYEFDGDSHDVKRGTDINSNITRLDNKLEGLAETLKNCEGQLANVQTQLESAKSEVDRVFPQEYEYAEKSARFKELNILLNMDEKDREILDAEPDEGDVNSHEEHWDRKGKKMGWYWIKSAPSQ